MIPARFVVGTGRCGSTLLARMLGEHRSTVPIQEFFTGLDWGRRFVPGPHDAAALVEIITAEQPVTTDVLARGHTSDEITYPFDAPGARFRPGDPMPWLLVSMLGHLGGNPDHRYDELVAHAGERPPATLAEHYADLFSFLARAAGGEVWVERSGSSLDYLGALVELYPDARFVHIHRDGHEAALSIRAHPFFRLAVAVLFDLFPAGVDEGTAIDHVLATPPPLRAVGQYWSDQVLRGFAALPELDRHQYLAVRFEDLVDRPADVVEQVGAFLELPGDPGFPPRAAALVRGRPPTRFDALDLAEQDELRDACRPGQVLLRRADAT